MQEKLAGKKPGDIVATLARRYTRLLQSMKNLTFDNVLEVYLNALAHVYDPHSDYMGRAQLDDFSIAMNLSLFGIGATLRPEDGYCKIYELVPGGPAARSGLLKPGDRIVAVGQDVSEAGLKDPLPWDRVPTCDFAREDHVSPFLNKLRERSLARVDGDQEFTYLREDIAQLKQSLATKTVSLNEADRRQEKAAAKMMEASRKQELAVGKESQPATYEITLKNAGSPGLPAPLTAAVAPTAKSLLPSPEEADEAEASIAKRDPVLHESERILADYVGMLHRPAAVAAAAH